MSRYRGKDSGSRSGPLLAHEALLCVLGKRIPLSDDGLELRMFLAPLTPLPQVLLFSAQPEQSHTVFLSCVHSTTVMSSTLNPVLILLPSAHRPHSGCWTPLQAPG
jgi:hypothetical protein